MITKVRNLGKVNYKLTIKQLPYHSHTHDTELKGNYFCTVNVISHRLGIHTHICYKNYPDPAELDLNAQLAESTDYSEKGNCAEGVGVGDTVY